MTDDRPPLHMRLLRFEQRRPDIFISPPWATNSGKWRVFDPGNGIEQFGDGDGMMDILEQRHPESG